MSFLPMPLIGPCLSLAYSSASALHGSMVKGTHFIPYRLILLTSFAYIYQGLANIERDLAAMYESKKDWRLFANTFIIWKATWAVVTPAFLLVGMLYKSSCQANIGLIVIFVILSLLSFTHCSRAKTI